ncbi:hypothetical protein E5288_WYG011305 [Bos mutus]|uniref:Uncharacterized protein n=1 Tax=Bos mutus TaxID=72004 RepID=A0A6B0R6T8_9CETA|nr:hypothetical protein [Bos mutus]
MERREPGTPPQQHSKTEKRRGAEPGKPCGGPVRSLWKPGGKALTAGAERAGLERRRRRERENPKKESGKEERKEKAGMDGRQRQQDTHRSPGLRGEAGLGAANSRRRQPGQRSRSEARRNPRSSCQPTGGGVGTR